MSVQTASATLSYARISPRKVKIVMDLIRNKPVGEAINILKNTPKAASLLVEKLIHSAIANAVHNYNLDADRLYVKEAYANDAPTMKRYQPRAKGMAYPILKRSSHITVTVAEQG